MNYIFRIALAMLIALYATSAASQKPHIPTLQEAVYGGLIRTEGGSNVNWIDG